MEIVRELTTIFGEPEYIVMEFATEDGEKGKRQKSRKQQWESNVKVNKLKSVDDYKKLLKSLQMRILTFKMISYGFIYLKTENVCILMKAYI